MVFIHIAYYAFYRKLLGYMADLELIHRDNMVLRRD